MQLPDRTQVEWIVWLDACSDTTRTTMESVQEAHLVTNANLGWVVDESPQRIVLAHGRSTSGEIDHFVIPTVCVVERRRLYASRQPKNEATR